MKTLVAFLICLSLLAMPAMAAQKRKAAVDPDRYKVTVNFTPIVDFFGRVVDKLPKIPTKNPNTTRLTYDDVFKDNL